MKLDAELEILNNLAATKGFKNKNQTFFSQLSFAKDSNASRYFLFVNSTKKPAGDKFRLSNNIEKIFCKFVNEGKATIILKEPNFSLIIKKANVAQLKTFLKLIHLAGNSVNIADELNKIPNSEAAATTSGASSSKENLKPSSEKGSKDAKMMEFKKPTTSLTIKSKSEYFTNFRAVISQNLKIKTAIGTKNNQLTTTLVKLTINNSDLKHIDPSMFELENLVYLDLSENKLTKLDDFSFKKLEELNLSHNLLEYLGKRIHLPKLINFDLNTNKLRAIDGAFCNNFRNISKLNLSNNGLKYVNSNFGYKLVYLKSFYMTNNLFTSLPFSFSYLRLQMLELHDNPFQYISPVPEVKSTVRDDVSHSQFPSLVEICARTIVGKKIKYKLGDIPLSLFNYLDTSTRCVCGQVSFEYKFSQTTLFELNRIAQSFTYLAVNGVSNNEMPLDMTLCSYKCFRKHCKLK